MSSPVRILSDSLLPTTPDDPSFRAAIYRGQGCIAMHDQEGFPYVISFEMFRGRREHVCALGCLVEATARNWPTRAVKHMVLCLHDIIHQASAEHLLYWARSTGAK